MSDNKKSQNFFAFIIGIIIGKKAIPKTVHIIYITIILIILAYSQYNPINTYFEILAKENANCVDKD